MLVLQIIGGLLALALVLFLLFIFDELCDEKFGHRFFKFSSFIILAVSVGTMMIGNMWYESSLESGSDTLNGLVLMIVGGLILLSVVFYNLKKTNFVYGLFGSTIQISIFGTLVLISLPIFAVFAVISIIGSFAAQPVYMVNK